MTAEREGLAEIARVLGKHLPRDRYDDQGHSLGTYCSGCGWTGDYFADGESGPFDLHLADALADVLAEAWERGHDECCAVYLRHCASAVNPYRVEETP